MPCIAFRCQEARKAALREQEAKAREEEVSLVRSSSQDSLHASPANQFSIVKRAGAWNSLCAVRHVVGRLWADRFACRSLSASSSRNANLVNAAPVHISRQDRPLSGHFWSIKEHRNWCQDTKMGLTTSVMVGPSSLVTLALPPRHTSLLPRAPWQHVERQTA